MNWEILVLTKDEIHFGILREYLVSQKSRMIIGSLLMSIGGITTLTLTFLGLITGFVIFLSGIILFRNGYRRFSNSLSLAISFNNKSKKIKVNIGLSSKSKRFSDVERILVMEEEKRLDPLRTRASKSLNKIKKYFLRIKFIDGEYLTLNETTDILEVPSLVFKAKVLNEFFKIETGNNFKIFQNNFQIPTSIPSYTQIIGHLFKRNTPNIYSGVIRKQSENKYLLDHNFQVLKGSLWILGSISSFFVFILIAVFYNPWNGILINNYNTSLLLTLGSVIMAFTSLLIIPVIIYKKPKGTIFDFKSGFMKYKELDSNSTKLRFSDFEYGNLQIFSKFSLLELATNSFYLRKPLRTTPIIEEFKNLLIEHKIIKDLRGFKV
ncbi:MAG: hypothetical protein HeimC3_36420 [Candidatus Heimdallarchaeota archaeon LC_3]|nr:MAG: hypothetical protein HeimC3_36420 [Candidatus Heimdallarchaeota archaeon LC_3]